MPKDRQKINDSCLSNDSNGYTYLRLPLAMNKSCPKGPRGVNDNGRAMPAGILPHLTPFPSHPLIYPHVILFLHYQYIKSPQGLAASGTWAIFYFVASLVPFKFHNFSSLCLLMAGPSTTLGVATLKLEFGS
jgi:hypothetical protein